MQLTNQQHQQPKWAIYPMHQAKIKIHQLYKNVMKAWEIIGHDRIIQSFMCYQDDRKDFDMIEVQIVKRKKDTLIMFSKTEVFDALEISEPKIFAK